MNRILSWVISNFTSKLPFVFVIILTAIIVFVFSLIENVFLKIEYVVAIFLFGALILSVFYFKELFKIDENFRKIESIPNDATMLNYEKRIIFDDQSLVDKSAITEAHKILHNNMDTVYNLFEIKIGSGSFVPKFEDIKFEKNGEPLILRRDVVNPELIEECKEVCGNKKVVSVTKRFNLPLHIEPKETCDFQISYRTFAYVNAINEKSDWYQYQVMRFTERIVIEIILQGEFKNKFIIKTCDEIEADGHQKIYQIYDGSFERMKTTEQALWKIKAIPRFKNDKMTWIINNPKIGYKYRVYFTLNKKE